MKVLCWCLFCRSRAHGLVTSNPAVTGGRRPLPVSAFSGPEAPPVTDGEVAQTFRSHSEETSANLVKQQPVERKGRVSYSVTSIVAVIDELGVTR